MTEEKIREFSLRISQTSRTGLVAITDEIIITYIGDAKKALGENDKEAFLFNIGKAKQSSLWMICLRHWICGLKYLMNCKGCIPL